MADHGAAQVHEQPNAAVMHPVDMEPKTTKLSAELRQLSSKEFLLQDSIAENTQMEEYSMAFSQAGHNMSLDCQVFATSKDTENIQNTQSDLQKLKQDWNGLQSQKSSFTKN